MKKTPKQKSLLDFFKSSPVTPELKTQKTPLKVLSNVNEIALDLPLTPILEKERLDRPITVDDSFSRISIEIPKVLSPRGQKIVKLESQLTPILQSSSSDELTRSQPVSLKRSGSSLVESETRSPLTTKTFNIEIENTPKKIKRIDYNLDESVEDCIDLVDENGQVDHDMVEKSENDVPVEDLSDTELVDKLKDLNESLMIEKTPIETKIPKKLKLDSDESGDDDFLLDFSKTIATKPNLKLKKNTELLSELDEIDSLLMSAQRIKGQREKYDALGKEIVDGAVEMDQVGERALEQVGLDASVLKDKDTKATTVTVFEYVREAKARAVDVTHWNGIEDEYTEKLVEIVKDETVFGRILEGGSISMWIRYGWIPEHDLLMVLISMGKSFKLFPSLLKEVNSIVEILDVEISYEDVLKILFDSGMPNVEQEKMNVYIKDYDEFQVPKKVVPEETLGEMRSTLLLLQAILPKITFNETTASEFLFYLTLLGMDSFNGYYRDCLFELISKASILFSSKMNWDVIANKWTEKVTEFCQDQFKSEVFLHFVEGCKNEAHNTSLVRWTRGISFAIVTNWDGQVTVPFCEPDLQILLEWLENARVFTKQTPSYTHTFIVVRLIRIMLDHQMIQANKVSLINKKICRNIGDLFRKFHGRIDDRLGAFLDRSKVKEELLRIQAVINRVLKP